MKFSNRKWRWAAIFAVALAGTACGDDDGNNGTSNNATTNNVTTNNATTNNATTNNGTSNNATTNNATTNNATTNNATTNNATTVDAIEVEGTWDTQFDTTEVIDEFEWNSVPIIEFNNDDNYAILQSPEDDMFTPNQFSRLVWTEPAGDVFYYCTVDFGLDTLEEAQNSTSTADDTDPETGGCGGAFPWTKMTRVQ